MKYQISQLIDLPQLERLMQALHRATGMPYGLVDNECNVLVGVGWKEICTRFHRAHPATVARCIESDRHVIRNAQCAPYVGYRCPQGLISYATPLVIEGEHLANVFTGQALNEPPDIGFFESQAEAFGFDKPSYLAALKDVPVLPKEKIEAVMAFLVELAQTLASNGLNRLRQMEAEESARGYAQRLQLMTQRVVSLQEAEQQKLARELHDRVSSNLWSVGLTLESLEKQLSAGTLDTARERLSECAVLLRDTIQTTRTISSDLHPATLDYSGLLPALGHLREKFAGQGNMAVDVTGSGCASRFAAEKELALFRIAQEALVNCAKHSQGTTASINLHCDPQCVRLSITDNGIGFNPLAPGQPEKHAGLGLLSMQERAAAVGGNFRIESLPGKGTQVIVEVPI